MPDGKLKNILILRKPSGWYVCLQVESETVEPQPSQEPPVGIDVGMHHALGLSDGTVIDSPQDLKAALVRLRKLQRKVARRKKGSQRRRKAVHQLVNAYGLIAIENLNLSFMLRNGTLSRAAHDVALGICYEILDYQAIEAGVEVVKVYPKNPSQQCNGCGAMVKKGLRVRTHQCPDCGFTADRDVNAALHILDLGWVGLSSVRCIRQATRECVGTCGA